MVRTLVAACVAIVAIAGCSKDPQRPIADGYTLHGVVLDAGTGAPVSDVAVLIGSEGELEFHEIALTDVSGQFTLKPAPPTAPSHEVLRLSKPGYATVEVLVRSATRVEAYRYRLEIRLQPLAAP